MSLKQAVVWLGKLPFKILWTCFTLNIYVLTEIIQFVRSLFSSRIRQMIYFFEECSLVNQSINLFSEMFNRFWNWVSWIISRFKQQQNINRRSFLRQRKSEQQITKMLESAEANPTSITEDEKVLMLMQKMRRLQQLILQQSNDRRKAENELHELKSQLTKKNAVLIKERSQSVSNIQKINLLSSELKQKQQLVQKSKEQIELLRQQIVELKRLIQQKQKQQLGQNYYNKQLKETQQKAEQRNQEQNSTEPTCQPQKQVDNPHEQNEQDQNLVNVKKTIGQKKKKKNKAIANN